MQRFPQKEMFKPETVLESKTLLFGLPRRAACFFPIPKSSLCNATVVLIHKLTSPCSLRQRTGFCANARAA